MKVVCQTYFKDDNGKWHQPGEVIDVNRDSPYLKNKSVIPVEKKKLLRGK